MHDLFKRREKSFAQRCSEVAEEDCVRPRFAFAPDVVPRAVAAYAPAPMVIAFIVLAIIVVFAAIAAIGSGDQ